MLVGHSGVFRNHGVKSVRCCQSKQFAVLDTIPFHERDGECVVSGEKRPKSMRQVFIKKDFHCCTVD